MILFTFGVELEVSFRSGDMKNVDVRHRREAVKLCVLFQEALSLDKEESLAFAGAEK
jgi:hypothetical protein